MEWILTIIGIIALIAVGGLVLVGLGIGFIIFLIIAAILAAVGFIFYFFMGTDGLLGLVSPDFSSSKIPDEFIACLQSQVDVNTCREQFTSWPKDRNDLLSQLSTNFKKDLGPKKSSNNWNIRMEEINGKGSIKLDRVSSYELNNRVTESFVLSKDGSDYKIDNFSINYKKGAK